MADNLDSRSPLSSSRKQQNSQNGNKEKKKEIGSFTQFLIVIVFVVILIGICLWAWWPDNKPNYVEEYIERDTDSTIGMLDDPNNSIPTSP